MVEALDAAIAAGQSAAADRNSGQMNFFESFAQASDDAPDGPRAPEAKLPAVTPWTDRERLAHEKAVLGLYVSSHPLDEYGDELQRFTSATIADIEQLAADTQVVIGGMLTRIRPTFVRKGRSAGQKMAMITIEDQTGPIDAVVFSDTYAIAAPLLTTDRIVFLKGKVDRRREEPSIVVDSIIPVERGAEELTQTVKIVLRDGVLQGNGNGNGNGNGQSSQLTNLHELLRRMSLIRGASAEVLLEVHQRGLVATLRLEGTRVEVTADMPQRVATALRADDCCQLLGPKKLAATAPRRQEIPADDALFATAGAGR